MNHTLFTILFTFLSFFVLSQEKKPIELSFMDYTENDSAFYNVNVPEDHRSQQSFDLYYRFSGDSTWLKVKKGKSLKLALLGNEGSAKQMKRYRKKKTISNVILLGGIGVGAIVAFPSPLGGVGIFIASTAVGYYVLKSADKHLLIAIKEYNQTIIKS